MGSAARPERLFPQQTTVPSVRTPQECSPPAETHVNDPPGAVLLALSRCCPQHSGVPPVRNPHVWNQAADNCLNTPGGGEP